MTYVYVASSWRNERQPAVIAALREQGIDCYDFRNPEGGTGFSWREVKPDYDGPAIGVDGIRSKGSDWEPAEEYLRMIEHPRAIAGFEADYAAMQRSDVVLMVLPCGKSAHLELGWAIGAGKRTVILLEDPVEPELMYRAAGWITTELDDVIRWLRFREVHEDPENPTGSNLVAHAIRELDRIGETGLEPPSMRKSILDVVRLSANQGHSGSSAAFASNVLDKLLRFQPLTPITSDPTEWNQVDEDTWQCNRDSECFSDDGGVTYRRLSEQKKILHVAVRHKPAEPTGLGAVVRDHDGHHWVRNSRMTTVRHWRSAEGFGRRTYADLDAAEVLFDGIDLEPLAGWEQQVLTAGGHQS